jgi:hypothetical protein
MARELGARLVAVSFGFRALDEEFVAATPRRGTYRLICRSIQCDIDSAASMNPKAFKAEGLASALAATRLRIPTSRSRLSAMSLGMTPPSNNFFYSFQLGKGLAK